MDDNKKKLLFSVTKKDFIIEPFKGSGKGGQHRNKTMSCVRIKHPESGAEVIATENRDQRQNKKVAFERIVKHPKFQAWLKLKMAECMGEDIRSIEERVKEDVEKAMHLDNLKIEYGNFED